MNPQAQPPTFSNDGARLYQTWWAEGIARKAGWPAEKTIAIAEPTDDVPSQVEAARERGVEHIICGFLPDEVDWPDLGWSELLEYFVERFAFAPWRLRLEPASTRAGAEAAPELNRVVAVCDTAELAVESLVAGCARALDGSGLVLNLDHTDAVELAAKLAGASLVINASTNWTLGFAVDELAAGGGIPFVRLRNPGYSPLRYGLLGVELPSLDDEEIPRLRTALSATGWPRLDGRQPPRLDPDGSAGYEADGWFEAPASAQRWRSLFGREAHFRFWSGEGWSRFRPAGLGEHKSWLNRAWGWAALAALSESSESAESVRRTIQKTVAAWVRIARKRRLAGALREAALGRWVRLHPEWIEIYRARARDVQGTAGAIVSWARRGVLWSTAPTALLPLVEAAAEAVDEGSSTSAVLALAAAWGGSWARVSELASAVSVVPPEWRAASVELCWSHLARIASAEAISQDELAALDGLLGQPGPWNLAMGAAALPLRCLAASRRNRASAMLGACREIVRRHRFGTSTGWSRLARTAFRTEQALLTWLRELSRAEAGETEMLASSLVRSWFAVRARELWQETRTLNLQRELSSARLLLGQYRRLVPADHSAMHLDARMAAFDDDDNSAAAAVHDFATAHDGNGRELPAVVAFIQARRGRREAAASLLQRWPARTTDAQAGFFQSIAWLWLDEEARALESMTAVLRTEPGFFRNETVPGGRWVLMAIALRRLGLATDAERFIQIAKRHPTTPAHFLEFYTSTEPGRPPRSGEWMRLIRR